MMLPNYDIFCFATNVSIELGGAIRPKTDASITRAVHEIASIIFRPCFLNDHESDRASRKHQIRNVVSENMSSY